MYINRYNYFELEKNALENPTQENLKTLADWFFRFGYNDYWNGECFEIDRDHNLYPICEFDNETEMYKIVEWEVR